MKSSPFALHLPIGVKLFECPMLLRARMCVSVGAVSLVEKSATSTQCQLTALRFVIIIVAAAGLSLPYIGLLVHKRIIDLLLL